MLAKEQYIGAAVLFGIALAVWVFIALWPQAHIHEARLAQMDSLRAVQDSLRKDSLAYARAQRDSLREARWQHKKDSFHTADSLRFAEWTRVRQLRYDSFRRADSLWRDSLGLTGPRRIKKDTILDLNRCDTTELLLIRGIGPYAATRIVRYREALGGFYSPVQLTDEPLARCHLDTLLHHFTADGNDVQTIPVNSCSIERLQRHPYLRYNQAKAIYNLRRRQARLHTIDELRGLPEIPDSLLLRIAPYLSFDE